MSLLPWEKRPFEIANLINPAFCCILLRDAIDGFEEKRDRGMPYSLSFLILPLVLHEKTRESLPEKVTTKMKSWLDDSQNQEIRIHFPKRVRQLVPYTKESLIFGMQRGVIDVSKDGNLMKIGKLSEESDWGRNYREKARFLGRWFADTGSEKRIFRLWGIRP